MKIAFDVDDTIWKIDEKHRRQVPDYGLIQILLWFANNGDEVFVWSAGGLEYAQTIVDKLGLTDMVTVIPKGEYLDKSNPFNIDLTFDDDPSEQIGKVNCHVKRTHA